LVIEAWSLVIPQGVTSPKAIAEVETSP
jgi:hypothetical protein